MSYTENERTETKSHGLNLKNRETLSLSGVEDVSGFDDNVVVLKTSLGRLAVHGSGLHIERIDLDAGELEMHGSISELVYEQVQGGSLLKRLFG